MAHRNREDRLLWRLKVRLQFSGWLQYIPAAAIALGFLLIAAVGWLTSRFYAAVAVGIWCANWETGCEALGLGGRFAVLTPDERGVREPPELPRYDVSWLVENVV